nr:transcription intermediary factor 1-alpha isoform X2 [Onthophagus taurus]
MAEGQVSVNDASFIELADIESENKSVDDMNTHNLGDIIMSELIQEHEGSESIKNGDTCEKSTLNSNQERTVESPSTGDNFLHKCVFCERVLSANDDPKLLECLHDSCGSCVHGKLEDLNEGQRKVIQCSTCEYNCEPDKIIDNQFLLETSNTEEPPKTIELKCSSCGDDNIATSWCVDCAEFICDICVQAHQRLKVTKDHVIKPKEDGLQENQTSSSSGSVPTLYCSIHPQEKLSLFCENCDQLTCRDCQLTQHREHKYKFTHEIAQDARKFISGMLSDISYKRVLLNSAMKVIDDRQMLIMDKKKALVNEITQLVVKLTNTINVRGKELVSKLTEVCESKQKTLQEKKTALDQLSKMTDHCIDFTKHALDNGSDMALLYSKKQVTNHLQRIKSKRADIPNPEVPVRIHLALDKVPDLIKGLSSVISTIGQIVVDGRVYPAQSNSPCGSLPPQNSPSPSHQTPVLHQQLNLLPQQQQHGVSQQGMHQMQQQQTSQQNQMPPNMHLQYPQQPRMLPPYGQQYNQNMQQNHQGMQQNHQNMQQNHQLGQKISPQGQMMQNNILAQHLHQQPNHMQQRMAMQRQVRPILPARPGLNNQQQVTSSTHPQALMQDRSNLRGLLQPNGNAVYVRTGPTQYQAVQPQYAQQFQNRFQSPPPQYQQNVRMLQQHGNQGGVRMTPRALQPYGMQQQQTHQQQQGPLKWHIPQQDPNLLGANRNSNNPNQNQPFVNDNFKITLKPQNSSDGRCLQSVSSTIPKTPSPNNVQGNVESSMDKLCAESVNDLMATIAKLDSNGVQVLAENRPKTGGSPHVDSSTGDLTAPPAGKVKSEAMDIIGKDDPNEDWCAVCMDGGELVCCDKCPKVFHQSCHIPNLSIEENDTWQCLLCMNFADIPESALNEKKEGQLSVKEKKIAERLVLELYCQFEPSIPFRELPPSENTEYYSIIKRPIALDTIRQKLDWNNLNGCYSHLEQLVRDARLMFQNAYKYNAVDSDIYNDAKTLEKFFDEQLEKWLPEYAYETFEDEDLHRPNKKFKRIITD